MSVSLECFAFLAEKAPAWAVEVGDLEKRIAERHNEISRVQVPVVRKVRKTGSTESIRPGKETESDNDRALESRDSDDSRGTQKLEILSDPQPNAVTNALSQSQVYHRQSKRKTTSVGSDTSGVAAKARTRSMIIVYYDSVVQTAFDQLVKHISMGRNRIRKAKQTEAMSRLTRSMENDDDEDITQCILKAQVKTGKSTASSPVPTFRSTRALNALSTTEDVEVDILSRLDKALETAQVFCETGAHLFLREGECDGQTKGAKEAFLTVARLSKEEMARSESEARDSERRRREKALLPTMEKPSNPSPTVAGLPPELGGIDGPIEADDDSDAEIELTPMPMLRYRQMART